MSRGRSPSGALSSRRWDRARRRALERDGWRCRDCGRAGKLEVHHLKPVRYRPERAFDLDNCRTLCRDCHFKRHRKPVPRAVKDWKALIRDLLP